MTTPTVTEDPCKDGHLPIGWDGPVYCEVCAKFLYYEDVKTSPLPPSMYIQFCGRVYRQPKDWQTNELVRLIMDRLVKVQDPDVYRWQW